MPRYHFHIRSAGGTLIKDEEGVHLPDIDAAREEARFAAETFGADRERGGYDTQAARLKSSARMGVRPSPCPLS